MSIIVQKISDADLRTTDPQVRRNAQLVTAETAIVLGAPDPVCRCGRMHQPRERAAPCLVCSQPTWRVHPLCAQHAPEGLL